MELPSKFLEQIAFKTRPKIEEQRLIVMNKGTHEEHLYQPLQTNKKPFKIGVTFLTGYNGIYNVTNKNTKFYLLKSMTDKEGYIQITIPPGAYEIESLNNEIKRRIVDDAHYTEADYPFTSKPNFPILGSIVEISSQGPNLHFYPMMVYDIVPDLMQPQFMKNITYHLIPLIFYRFIIFFSKQK